MFFFFLFIYYFFFGSIQGVIKKRSIQCLKSLKGGALKPTPLMDLRNLSDFSEFWRFFADFCCKWKLNIHTLQIKSFSPPSLVFYPLFSDLKICVSKVRYRIIRSFQGWKEGGKKLMIRKVWMFSFHLHQKSAKNLWNSWN